MNKQINKQIKSVNDVQQQISFTREAVPAEGHRSGRWKMVISGLSARWQEWQFWQIFQDLSFPWNLKSFKEWAPSYLVKKCEEIVTFFFVLNVFIDCIAVRP